MSTARGGNLSGSEGVGAYIEDTFTTALVSTSSNFCPEISQKYQTLNNTLATARVSAFCGLRYRLRKTLRYQSGSFLVDCGKINSPNK